MTNTKSNKEFKQEGLHLRFLFIIAFEITKGCYEVSISNLTDNLKTIICTGIITFGGFCIHSQAMTFLKECNISYKFFLKQKISQTIIAIIIATILSTFIL